MRIGIDVGGTNTDAVLMDGSRVVTSHKTATTPDVSSGIVAALTEVLASGECAPQEVGAGTRVAQALDPFGNTLGLIEEK